MTISTSSNSSEIVIPLHIEEVSVSRRMAERNVRVHIRTVSHDRVIDEPLVHEKIEIERVAIGRQVDVVPPDREEGDTTIISVVEEVLVVERRLILKEEIRLRRVRTTEQYQELVTLRDQQVVIERSEPGERAPDPRPESATIPKPQALRNQDV
jgi:stress response protein YsnF